MGCITAPAEDEPTPRWPPGDGPTRSPPKKALGVASPEVKENDPIFRGNPPPVGFVEDGDAGGPPVRFDGGGTHDDGEPPLKTKLELARYLDPTGGRHGRKFPGFVASPS